jgi:hypothetical protein
MTSTTTTKTTSGTATAVLPFQTEAMTPAQLAAVSYLARYTGHTHELYAAALRRGSAGARPTTSTRWQGFSGRTSSCTSGTCTRRGCETPRSTP